MNTQPKALFMADVLELAGDDSFDSQAAAELRRLHVLNQELLEALKELRAVMPIFPKDGDVLIGYKDRYNAARFKASAAIAKATGEHA